MGLERLCKEVSCGGSTVRVIDDRALLDHARKRGCTPAEAQGDALERGILPLRYIRNLLALGFEEQRRVCAGSAFVCGCGGLGGVILQNLARAGVGRLRFADGDRFTEHNLNRQWFADTEALDQLKAEVAARRIHALNPFVFIEPQTEMLDEENAERLIGDVDLAVDGLDDVGARFILAGTARRMGVPFVHGAVAGWLGQVSTFLPDGPLTLDAIYGHRRTRDESELDMGVLAPTASVVGSIMAGEALRMLAGRPPAYTGRLLYYEGESGSFEILPLVME